jgi:Icc-related predicted phosphoesterase
MRILLVSDLHYSLKQLDWVVAESPHYDLVVVAGDSLNIASVVPLEAQSVVILEYLALFHAATRVAVSSGNHDLIGPDENGEQAALWLREARAVGIPTDGDSVFVDDALLTICPWWDGPAGRESVADLLDRDASRRPDTWIWIYHWPPLGSPTCWTGQRDYGDGDLAGWIEQHKPDLVLTGHVHQSPFVDQGSWSDLASGAWVFNAGNQRGPVPARIEIDLTARVATWVSLMGTETIDLTKSAVPARTIF